MEKTHKQVPVVIAIVERNNTILILRRVDPGNPIWHHKWELPGGGIEPGESVEDALIREVKEETSLDVVHYSLAGIHTHTWDHPDYFMQTFLMVYKVRAKDTEVVLSEENDMYEWMTIDRIRETAADHLSANVAIIEKFFAPAVLIPA